MAIERAIGSARSGLLEERGEIGRFSASFFSQDRFGYRPKSILHIVALRNSAFPGKEIGPSRVSFGKLRFLRRSPYHLSRTIPKNSNFFRIVPRYSFAHVFRPILTIYMQVALLENEIFRAINDERKKGRREEEKERITGSFSSGRSEMGFSNWTRENSSVRRRTLDSSCSLFLLSEGRNREREREREASLAAFPDRSVGNRRREKERLINRRKRFR